MSRENVELVTRMWNTLAAGDLDLEFWHPEARIDNAQDWPVAAVYHGREGLQRWWDDLDEAFADFGVELLEAIDVDDDRVLTVQRFYGHFRVTGIEFDGPWASILTIRDQMVVHAVGYLTKRQALEAAGLK